jgi:hypothetical protein
MGNSPQEAQAMANQMLGRGADYAAAPQAPPPSPALGMYAAEMAAKNAPMSRLTGKRIPGTPGGPPSMAPGAAQWRDPVYKDLIDRNEAASTSIDEARAADQAKVLSDAQIKERAGQQVSEMLAGISPQSLTPAQQQMAQRARPATAVAATPQQTRPTG